MKNAVIVTFALSLALTVASATADAATKAKKKHPVGKKAGATTKAAPVKSAATGSRRVAVLELASLGLPEEMRHNLELLLINSVRTMQGVQLIPPLDVQMLLQSPKNADLAVCGGGPECAVRIAKAAGADVVVFGTLGAIGDSFSLNLRALQVATNTEVGRQNVGVSGSRDKLIPEVRLAAYRLLAPEQLQGALMVDTDLDGVAIAVDGTDSGFTPLPKPIESLTPGEHKVTLKHIGYAPLEQTLTIRPFETTRLRLDLKKAD